MRKIVLDTETTGLETSQGHRIIEIGCVEVINRKVTGNTYHQYINPERDIDEGAFEVHGISNEFLSDKPKFTDIVKDFLNFIRGAELIIHNAPFDTGFINYELSKIPEIKDSIDSFCTILDTLVLARKLHPGQKNNLDALCKRYNINNTERELHGALLDAEILSDVYLAMTGGQVKLSLDGKNDDSNEHEIIAIRRVASNRSKLRIITASDKELAAHQQILTKIDSACETNSLWQTLDSNNNIKASETEITNNERVDSEA